jgi:hypothetical protein
MFVHGMYVDKVSVDEMPRREMTIDEITRSDIPRKEMTMRSLEVISREERSLEVIRL